MTTKSPVNPQEAAKKVQDKFIAEANLTRYGDGRSTSSSLIRCEDCDSTDVAWVERGIGWGSSNHYYCKDHKPKIPGLERYKD